MPVGVLVVVDICKYRDNYCRIIRVLRVAGSGVGGGWRGAQYNIITSICA